VPLDNGLKPKGGLNNLLAYIPTSLRFKLPKYRPDFYPCTNQTTQ
jgi:hypothetical protein